jgi:pimeloyl-ACP methyl ester carboxylesterase
MPRAVSNGISLVYDDRGRGEPALLFLPGWCVPRAVFRELVPHAATTRRVLALDWRGHGDSGPASGDFGMAELVDDAAAVIVASRAREVVPVALAHAGWVAIELRRRLGLRIPQLVLLDWMVLGAPAAFFDTLHDMQTPERWRETVDAILERWLNGADNPALVRFLREEVGAGPPEMWARAAREIAAAFGAAGSPLGALASLAAPPAVLHLYAQPDDAGFLTAQEAFAATHPWFQARHLEARSHFPVLEVPAVIASAIEEFVGAEVPAPAARGG